MAVIYVARSVKLADWGSEVGLSKHLYKLGVAAAPVKPLVAAGWAGETDWTLVKQQEAAGVEEAEVLARLARKEKPIDTKYYPRLRDAAGVFKVDPAHVESHILVTRALAGESDRVALRLKPADFAAYLIHNALK